MTIAAAVALGALGASLIIAVGVVAAQRVLYRRAISVALKHETSALDRARAAEIRSAQQLDAMLDRISTSPRIEVRPAVPPVDPEARRYIADHEADDAAWNEFRGETVAVADE